MKRFIVPFVGLSLVLFPLFAYTYLKGGTDGVVHYKRSKQFEMTLYSMYRFGYMDGADTCKK